MRIMVNEKEFHGLAIKKAITLASKKLTSVEIVEGSVPHEVIGRYGSFKYNNQDHSILMGLLAAENILNNKEHNLWDLNTDYEYQEDYDLKL